MKEASLYEVIDTEKLIVRCHLCHHHCKVKNRRYGFCCVRYNDDGKLYSMNYGKIVSESVDPIEKKPIFHLLPGSLSYSIATVGCNFRCKHCQNHQISQYPRLNPGQFPGLKRTPKDIVLTAQHNGCESISYTYVEPTIFYEFALEAMRIASETGIKNVFVSNGYMSRTALKQLAPFLSAINVDLKAFTENFYRKICNAKLSQVLKIIELLIQLNIWTEVTTLIIPGLNDTDDELRSIAKFLANLDPRIPWHVSRFHPTYQMRDRHSTPTETLLRARQIGLAEGLQNIYTGNIPGEGAENTVCPGCGKSIVNRIAYQILENKIENGHCSFCSTPIAGIFALQ